MLAQLYIEPSEGWRLYMQAPSCTTGQCTYPSSNRTPHWCYFLLLWHQVTIPCIPITHEVILGLLGVTLEDIAPHHANAAGGKHAREGRVGAGRHAQFKLCCAAHSKAVVFTHGQLKLWKQVGASSIAAASFCLISYGFTMF